MTVWEVEAVRSGIGNLEALGDAPVLAPATELAFWRSPVARHPPFWAHTDPAGIEALGAAETAGRVQPFAGTATLAPGIAAFEVGGHLPGRSSCSCGRPIGPCCCARTPCTCTRSSRSPDGERLGTIRTPEAAANLTFGGPKRNRLSIAATTSLYAVYLDTRGVQRP